MKITLGISNQLLLVYVFNAIPKTLYTELIKFVVFVNKCLFESKSRAYTTSLKIQTQCMQQYKKPMKYWQIKKRFPNQLLIVKNPFLITIRYACFFMFCVSLFTCTTVFLSVQPNDRLRCVARFGTICAI